VARGKGEGSIYKRNQPNDKRWVATIELPRGVDGKRRRKTIARKTKREVIDALHDAQRELERHGDLQTRSMTVKKWMHYWLDKIAQPNLAPNTVTGYRNNVENFIVPLLGRKKLKNLTAVDVRKLHEEVMNTPADKRLRGKTNLPPGTKMMSPTSALLAHNTLSAALKAAVNDGHLSINVCDGVTKPKKAVVKKKYLDFDQAVHLLKYVADKPNGAMWATYLLLGTRRGEGAAIEAGRVTDIVDLSWQLQRITDIAKVPKNYEHRHVRGNIYLVRPKSSQGWRQPPLVEPLKSILERHIGDQQEGLIFLDHKDEAWDPGDVGKAWKKTLAEAGLPTDVELHGSRRTTATLLRAAGVPLTTIQAILGHASVDVTETYTVGSKHNEMVDALNKLSDHLQLTS